MKNGIHVRGTAALLLVVFMQLTGQVFVAAAKSRCRLMARSQQQPFQRKLAAEAERQRGIISKLLVKAYSVSHQNKTNSTV